MQGQGVKSEIDKLLEEKGNFSIAALTVKELSSFLDHYYESREKTAFPEEKVQILVDQKEICDTLEISRTTLYKLRLNGEIPEYRVGKQLRFALEEVKAALKIKNQANTLYF
jgi:excisionase family DNA binding protein